MLTPRQFAIVLTSGLLAATAVIAIGTWRARQAPTTDGSFELVEPGVFVEPAPSRSTAPSDAGTDQDLLGVSGLVDSEGRPADLAIYRGGPVVVNIWFSTCAPCERELRDFAQVYDTYGDQVAFVGVDPFDTIEVMNEFAAERGVTYDLVRDPDQAFVGAAGVSSYPTTLFIGANGEVVDRAGALDAEELTQRLQTSFEISPPG